MPKRVANCEDTNKGVKTNDGQLTVGPCWQSPTAES